MFRMSCISLIYIFIAFSSPTWADDEQDIRNLIKREHESSLKGDIAAVMSCFAPGYVMYMQHSDDPRDIGFAMYLHGSDDPDDIVVQINGFEELRSYVEKNAQSTAPVIILEIEHVSIKGDKAVATARYRYTITIMPRDRTIWMVSKVDGKWLITSSVTTIELSSSGSNPTATDSEGKTKSIEAKVIIGQIITLERAYYKTNGRYVDFPAGANCPPIGYTAPTGSTVRFTYSFRDSVATAMEVVDTNGDGAADDSLMLSVTNNMTVGAGTVGDPLSW
jgi:hypothetical protein